MKTLKLILSVILIGIFTQASAQTVIIESSMSQQADTRISIGNIQVGQQFDLGHQFRLNYTLGYFTGYNYAESLIGPSASLQIPVIGNTYVEAGATGLYGGRPVDSPFTYAADFRLGFSTSLFDLSASYSNMNGNWFIKPVSVRLRIN